MKKYQTLYFVMFLMSLGCTTNELKHEQPSKAEILRANEIYGWSLIGESLLENSPVDKLRLSISRPHGLNSNIFTVSKFPTHFLICQKEISGNVQKKDFIENCKSIDYKDYEAIWESSLNLIREKRNDIYPAMLNDYPNSIVEIFLKSSGLTKVETDICETINWPISLAKKISSTPFIIALPPCPPPAQ